MMAYYGITRKSEYPSTGLFLQRDQLENIWGYRYSIEELEIADGAKVGDRFYMVMAMYGGQQLGPTKSYSSEAEAEAACAKNSAEIALDPEWEGLDWFVSWMEVVDPDEEAAEAREWQEKLPEREAEFRAELERILAKEIE